MAVPFRGNRLVRMTPRRRFFSWAFRLHTPARASSKGRSDVKSSNARTCSTSSLPLTVVFVFTLALTPRFASAQNPLPVPWQQGDVGAVGLAGSASQGPDGDLFIKGAGSDIW